VLKVQLLGIFHVHKQLLWHGCGQVFCYEPSDECMLPIQQISTGMHMLNDKFDSWGHVHLFLLYAKPDGPRQ
jgi:hypothetical protein